jgi:hypothetical protein
MIGWRFWVLLAVAAGVALWATSSLMLFDGQAPRVPAVDAEGGPGDAEQIREESRRALREILREAEPAEDRPR